MGNANVRLLFGAPVVAAAQIESVLDGWQTRVVVVGMMAHENVAAAQLEWKGKKFGKFVGILSSGFFLFSFA